VEPNCFACPGINQECVNERRYVPYTSEERCLYKAIADQDEARLKIRDFGSIKLRIMFAQYLLSIVRKKKH